MSQPSPKPAGRPNWLAGIKIVNEIWVQSMFDYWREVHQQCHQYTPCNWNSSSKLFHYQGVHSTISTRAGFLLSIKVNGMAWLRTLTLPKNPSTTKWVSVVNGIRILVVIEDPTIRNRMFVKIGQPLQRPGWNDLKYSTVFKEFWV